MSTGQMQSKAAQIAYEKGYRVQGNRIISPKGKTRKLKKNDVYPKFNISHLGKTVTVKCHHLTAWQKYREKCIGEEIIVRHLDDDAMNFSVENIELGTCEDNIHDKYVNATIREWVDLVNSEYRELEKEIPF